MVVVICEYFLRLCRREPVEQGQNLHLKVKQREPAEGEMKELAALVDQAEWWGKSGGELVQGSLRGKRENLIQ
ncbi:hypothetical protein MRB53_023703 [Persea americana]|uniref:Uncharacterized protein n=1 Tax=Persea americana TaxID=3435 RepID=A0ACC2LAU9_PERAE|nr:hypothetical protein MRB53_023703 [Persea americana]